MYFTYSILNIQYDIFNSNMSEPLVIRTTRHSEKGSDSRCINGRIREIQLCPDKIYNADGSEFSEIDFLKEHLLTILNHQLQVKKNEQGASYNYSLP